MYEVHFLYPILRETIVSIIILDQQQVKIRGVEGGEDEFSVFFNLFKMTWGLFSVEVRSSLVLVKAFEAVRSLQLGSQPVPTNLI